VKALKSTVKTLPFYSKTAVAIPTR